MAKSTTIQAFFPTRGGMIAPHELRILAETSATHGSGSLLLTARQEIMLPGLLTEAFRPLKQRLAPEALWPMRPGLPPNIVTSWPAVGAEGSRGWLREGVFSDILAGFQSRPAIPVCIADPGQRQVPVSLGVINFHAAEREDLWHVQVALPDGEYVVLPGAVRSGNIAGAVRRVEAVLSPDTQAVNADELTAIQSTLRELFTPAAYEAPPSLEQYSPLTTRHPGGASLCPVAIPALAGRLHCDFLQEICVWAMRHGFSQLGITPWKSLVTPAVSVSQYRELQHMLVRRRVYSEQGPWRGTWYDSRNDASVGEGLRVQLTQSCPTDTGVSVAVIGPMDPVPDLHIAVREEPAGHHRFRKPAPRFSILWREGLNLRAPGMKVHAEGVEVSGLAHEVMRLIEGATEASAVSVESQEVEDKAPRKSSPPAWRCTSCLTEYSEELGDPLGSIAPGTAFDAIPDSWVCPTCGESRDGFNRVCAA